MSTQIEQVINAMRKNGGYATFGQLNQLVDVADWATKTPQASIRRIVQDSEDKFFRIEAGLWALKECEQAVLKKLSLKDGKPNEKFTHSYYQGLVVKLGEFKGFATYVPPQNRNHLFLEKPLRELTTCNDIYEFGYKHLIDEARTVDVIWFNERKMPQAFYEVEHSTSIIRSLEKFYALQDFYAKFYIIAHSSREREYNSVLEKPIHKAMKNRVSFYKYENLVKMYEMESSLAELPKL